MVRRFLLVLALTAPLGVACTPTHPECYIVRFGGQAPDDWVYIDNARQWVTWIGGQLITMGYSATIDSTIWNAYNCTLDNLSDRIRLAR